MFEIAGGILIAAAVIAFVLALFRNPAMVWEGMKIFGAVCCAVALVIAIVVQLW